MTWIEGTNLTTQIQISRKMNGVGLYVVHFISNHKDDNLIALIDFLISRHDSTALQALQILILFHRLNKMLVPCVFVPKWIMNEMFFNKRIEFKMKLVIWLYVRKSGTLSKIIFHSSNVNFMIISESKRLTNYISTSRLETKLVICPLTL